MIRSTYTRTTVFATAPCGHRVGVPNEAYEEICEVQCPGDPDGPTIREVCQLWAVLVVDLVGLPTARFAPAAAEDLARAFHETYERLAPDFGYITRPESAVPWERVPAPARLLMMATAGEAVRAVEVDGA